MSEGGEIRPWALLLASLLSIGSQCCHAASLRPVSASEGICLAGLDDFNIEVDGPVDVEFASLIYKGRVVGQFQITILGPDQEVPGNEIERWRHGEVVLVKDKDSYVGIKRSHSGDAYPNVYIYLSVGRGLPHFASAASIMHALTTCNLKASIDWRSTPPKLDSVVAGAPR